MKKLILLIISLTFLSCKDPLKVRAKKLNRELDSLQLEREQVEIKKTYMKLDQLNKEVEIYNIKLELLDKEEDSLRKLLNTKNN